MSTFLGLVQDLWREAGAAGIQPVTCQAPTGETRRFTRWIQRADAHIQNLYTDWKFLKQTTSIATVAAQSTITTPLVPAVVAAGLGEWDFESVYCIYPGANGVQTPIDTVEYQQYRKEVLDTLAQGAPSRVVIMPDNTWRTDPPVPDAVYTIGSDYHAQPTMLTADSDISLIPQRFHEAILGKALMYYGNFENAADAKTQGQELYEDYFQRLFNSQEPNNKTAHFRSGGFFEVVAE